MTHKKHISKIFLAQKKNSCMLELSPHIRRDEKRKAHSS